MLFIYEAHVVRLRPRSDKDRGELAQLRRTTGITLYWGYIGIMEKKMETTGIMGIISGLHERRAGHVMLISKRKLGASCPKKPVQRPALEHAQPNLLNQ